MPNQTESEVTKRKQEKTNPKLPVTFTYYYKEKKQKNKCTKK